MSEVAKHAPFVFVIDGVEPFTCVYRFDDLIVAAVADIDPRDERPTRTILSEKFGGMWSGEKLKRPLFNLMMAGRLQRIGMTRYVVAP